MIKVKNSNHYFLKQISLEMEKYLKKSLNSEKKQNSENSVNLAKINFFFSLILGMEIRKTSIKGIPQIIRLG